MSSELQLDVRCLSCCGGDIWWTLTKERQAWCYLQVTVWSMPERFVRTSLAKKALYKYSSFPFLYLHTPPDSWWKESCSSSVVSVPKDLQHSYINYICSKILPESLASVMEKLHGSSAIWNVRNTDSYKQQLQRFRRFVRDQSRQMSTKNSFRQHISRILMV